MKIADKNTSAVKLVKDALKKAHHYKEYNIFTYIDEDGAIKRAEEIDAKIKKGETVGRLAGVPYALKDNFLSPRGETTASAHILQGFTSPITATAVEKIEAEGAIMIGRTNMDAFAHGSSTENSYFGPTLNAHDKERVAGGSSGGSAAAVALDIVEFATGTDTGGSIRQPASFNGVYGLKPTYGCISRYGVVAMASSTDCIGFFTKTPDDIDLLMSIASGQDPKDLTTLPDYYNTPDFQSDNSRPRSLAPVFTGLAPSSSVATSGRSSADTFWLILYTTVPTGTSTIKSLPLRPAERWPEPFLPSSAVRMGVKRKSTSVSVSLSALKTMSPPLPPSPPSGPPFGM